MNAILCYVLLAVSSWEVISRDHIVAGRVFEMCKLRGCRQVPVSDDHNAFCKCAVSGHAVNDHDMGRNGRRLVVVGIAYV